MAVASLASSAFTRIGDELGPETTRLKSVFPTDMILSVSVCVSPRTFENFIESYSKVPAGSMPRHHAYRTAAILIGTHLGRCNMQFTATWLGVELTEREHRHFLQSGSG